MKYTRSRNLHCQCSSYPLLFKFFFAFQKGQIFNSLQESKLLTTHYWLSGKSIQFFTHSWSPPKGYYIFSYQKRYLIHFHLCQEEDYLGKISKPNFVFALYGSFLDSTVVSPTNEVVSKTFRRHEEHMLYHEWKWSVGLHLPPVSSKSSSHMSDLLRLPKTCHDPPTTSDF